MMSQSYSPTDSEREADYLNLLKARMTPPYFIFVTGSKDRWKSDVHTGQRSHVFDKESD